MDTGDEAGPRVEINQRSNYHPIRWVLLSGSRVMLTLLLSVLIFVVLLVVGTVWRLEMGQLVQETRAVQSLFATLLGGIILFVSVVLSINIAALSQEFAPLRSKQVRIEETLAFQDNLEQFVDDGTSPTDINGFYLFALEALATEADTLRERATTIDDETARQEVLGFVNDIDEKIDIVEGRVRAQQRQMWLTLLAGLEWDPIHHIYLARRIRSIHDDALEDSHRATLNNLVEILTSFASGSEYFTTLYFKRELRALSERLVTLALPVIVFTAYVLLAVDADLIPTWSIYVQPRLLYVSFAFVVALSPYILLSAFMLRIIAVSKRSLASGGFTLTEVAEEPTED